MKLEELIAHAEKLTEFILRGDLEHAVTTEAVKAQATIVKVLLSDVRRIYSVTGEENAQKS